MGLKKISNVHKLIHNCEIDEQANIFSCFVLHLENNVELTITESLENIVEMYR